MTCTVEERNKSPWLRTNSTTPLKQKALVAKPTMDYFDWRIGLLEDSGSPDGLQFAAALLSETLAMLSNQELPENISMYLKKLRLGTILIHLATRIKEFTPLFKYYCKITKELELNKESAKIVDTIEDNVIAWCNSGTKFDYSILEVQDDNKEQVEVDSDYNHTNDDVIEGNSDFKENIAVKKIRKPRKKKAKLKHEFDEVPDEKIKELESTNEEEDENPVFSCNLCEFKCSTGARNLDKHQFTAHQTGASCPHCLIKFQEFVDYEKHSLMHVYHCDKCNKPFAGIGGLRIHKRQHMPFYLQNKAKNKRLVRDSKSVSCKICGDKIEKKNVAEHIKEKHAGTEMLSCEKCDYTSWNKFYLKDHVKRVHFLQHISCTICGKVVKNLDKHIDRCHMTEGSHPCDMCGKLFAAKANLMTHIKNIHRQIKDYHCDQCTYSTYTKHNLRLHMKSHTGETTERECNICGKVTNSIEWHMNLFHKEESKQKNESQSLPKQNLNQENGIS